MSLAAGKIMHNKTTTYIARLLQAGFLCVAVGLPGWANSATPDVHSIASDAPILSADGVMVVDIVKNQVLYSKNADVERPHRFDYQADDRYGNAGCQAADE